MKGLKDSRFSTAIWALAVAFLGLSGFFSYRAYSMSRDALHSARLAMLGLQADVTRLKTKLDALDQRYATLESNYRSGGAYSRAGDKAAQASAAAGKTGAVQQAAGELSLLEDREELNGLLNELRTEMSQRKDIALYQRDLIEKKKLLLKADANIYGQKLLDLYKTARATRDSSVKDGEREAAFNQMVQQYPDSYATSVVVAERALQEALNANSTAVESYYNLLRESRYGSSVVTEQGVNAVPSIQGFLAQNYIQNGRIGDAEAVIQSLEQNSAGGYVAVPGPQGQPEYRPVAEVVDNLRTQIATGVVADGPPPPPTRR